MSTWTKLTDSSLAWNKQTSDAGSTWNKVASGEMSWKNGNSNDFLLKEDSYYLLLETGFRIIIREHLNPTATWDKLANGGQPWNKLT